MNINRTNNKKFPVEMFAAIKKAPNDFRLLEKIPYSTFVSGQRFPLFLSDTVGDEKPMVIIDTETTGLSTTSKIIELALIRVLYSPSISRITCVESVYCEFEDPHEDIPYQITELTGITNEDVQGQEINESRVAALLADRPLMVAHNAGFDRPFFERRFAHISSLLDLPWACTMRGIKWRMINPDLTSSSLMGIAMGSGYFYDAHRASSDCFALIWLLNLYPEALSSLLNSADAHFYIIKALEAPFKVKDVLKERDYRWDGNERVWYKNVGNIQQLETEKKFLFQLYQADIANPNKQFTSIEDAFHRFKK